jgi:hypothetical protein
VRCHAKKFLARNPARYETNPKKVINKFDINFYTARYFTQKFTIGKTNPMKCKLKVRNLTLLNVCYLNYENMRLLLNLYIQPLEKFTIEVICDEKMDIYCFFDFL